LTVVAIGTDARSSALPRGATKNRIELACKSRLATPPVMAKMCDSNHRSGRNG